MDIILQIYKFKISRHLVQVFGNSRDHIKNTFNKSVYFRLFYIFFKINIPIVPNLT